MHDIDITLMLGTKAGDTRSFEKLVERHQKSVLNVIYRYIGDGHLAEDLTQEVFLRVYQARKSYRPEAKFTTWLYTIVKHLCLNELKRKGRKVYSVDAYTNDSDIKPAQYMQAPGSSPSEIIEKKEIARVVKEVVAHLPPNQRMAVVLNKYEGLSYQEIGKSMGISIKAVKSLLLRARVNIKDKLSAYINK